MITDNTTYKGRTLGQWIEMAQRSEAEIVRLAGELSEKAAAPMSMEQMTKLGELATDWANMPDSDTEGQAWWSLVDFVNSRAALASAAPVEAAPLTPEEIDEIARKYNLDGSMLHGSRFKDYLRPFARAIEVRIKGGVK